MLLTSLTPVTDPNQRKIKSQKISKKFEIKILIECSAVVTAILKVKQASRRTQPRFAWDSKVKNKSFVNIIKTMLCYVMLCYVMLCYVMLCYVMLCYVML